MTGTGFPTQCARGGGSLTLGGGYQEIIWPNLIMKQMHLLIEGGVTDTHLLTTHLFS